jgi:hypothetical protein
MPSDTTNPIRHLLQSKMPEKMLDLARKDRRAVEIEGRTKVKVRDTTIIQLCANNPLESAQPKP